MDLKEKIDNLPKTPGIYMMKDKYGDIIYVGKSKKLKERVKSYFVNSKNHSKKVKRMVKNIEDLDVILTDTIPILLLNPEFSLDGVNFQPWTGRLNLDTVAPGQVVTIIIRGTVSPDATGVISNTAIINSSTPDPNFDNNNSTIENPITPIGTEADLSLIKQSNILNATPGEAFSYTITVSNAGPDAAQDVIPVSYTHLTLPTNSLV